MLHEVRNGKSKSVKLVTVVGARPQFIKAAAVSKAIKDLSDIEETIVHTGQHYDHQMSQVFFDELDVPRPKHNLQVGSAGHGRQTGGMLIRLEEILLEERPDVVLVYGDTNSTLAGALAASKLHIPVTHVEAGMRSYNRQSPEEINRVVTDHLSSLLLCPTENAVANLAKEGVHQGVHLIGDVMYDASLLYSESAESLDNPLAAFGVEAKRYAVMTCHRAENTDNCTRLTSILRAVNEIATELPVLFPVHPRTRGRLNRGNATFHPQLKLIEPVSYLEMLALERNAALILTDSGGIQKEAFFFGVPCVTTRDETEWPETVETGANMLAGAQCESITRAARSQLHRSEPISEASALYGGGRAAATAVQLIHEFAKEDCSFRKVPS